MLIGGVRGAVGPNYVISDGGDVTLISGGVIVFVDGFSVEGSGVLRTVFIEGL